MSKKRTKKEKAAAKHTFLYSWNNWTDQGSTSLTVNRQTDKHQAGINHKKINDNNAYLLDKESDLTSIKRGVIKSLIIVSLILATEVVLYFLWS
jgi:hypothetical protein